MPFKAYYLSPEGYLQQDLSEGEVRAAFEPKQGLLWVDISETTEEDGEFLKRTFNFHHLAVEDCVSPQQTALEAIMKLKRSTLRIHRVVAPQQEILNRLSRGEFPLIKGEALIFYRDVYDHRETKTAVFDKQAILS